MNSSTTLRPPRELRSQDLLGLSVRTLAAMMLIALAFVPLRLHAQGLTGTYTADDGGIYYVQQSGSVLWWAGLSLDSGSSADHQWHRGLSFTNVFRGNVDSDGTITGEWADVSRGTTLNSGTLKLAIGNSGGVPQLTRTAVTGGFGGTTWTQTGPLDDTLLNGTAEDIVSRFNSVTKNNGETLLNPNLTPYRDQTVVYARVVNTQVQYLCSGAFSYVLCSDNPLESEIPHVNYDPPFDPAIPHYPNFGIIDRTYAEFLKANAGDADFDMRVKINLDKMEPDFYTTGWGGRTYGPEVFNLKFNDATTHQKLNYASNEAYLGAETIMFGETTGGESLLPGWSDANSNSVLVNGRPINGYQSSASPPPYCNFIQPCPYLAAETPAQLLTNYLAAPDGIALNKLLLSAYGNGEVPSDPTQAPGDGIGTYLRITGALILDCGHFVETNLLGHTCFDGDNNNPDDEMDFVSKHQNQEIHPVYSIDVINSPFRPEDHQLNARMNLTGAWGGSDGSTYYIRQIGNTVWWLGMMRDRQPIMRGSAFDIIGMPQIAAAGLLVGSPICPPGSECWMFASVLKGVLTQNSDGSATITGDWAGVPQSTSQGSTGSSGATFTVDAYRKHVTPVKFAGLFPPLQKLYEPEDTTPPQSTLAIGSPQYPSASAQPFVTSATPFTVTATDAESGPQNIWYRFLMQGSAAPAYTPVIAPSAMFTLTGSDGLYELDTYATDNAGNDETSHSNTVYLDNTPPIAAITQPTTAQYGHSDVLTLSYSVSDGAGSGVMSFTPKMDGQTAAQFGTSLNSGQMIYLESMSLGTHTFSVDSVDNLGNAGANSVVFSIAVTFASLEQDVTNLVSLGCIDNIAHSLIAKMNAAQNLYGKGQIQTAINMLSAAINEVQAQAGKHISMTCNDPNGRSFSPVNLLAGDIQYLQGTLAGQLTPDPIVGSVVSSGNLPVDGATVNLMSGQTLVATTTTDSVGFYSFVDVSSLAGGGSYAVTVTLPKGFKASTPSAMGFIWSGNMVVGDFVLN